MEGTPSEINAVNYFSEPLKNELDLNEIDEAKFAISELRITRPNDSIENE